MADVFFTGDDRLHNYGLTLQTPCLGQSSAFAEQLAGAYEMAPDPTGCFFNPCFTNPVTTEDYASFIFKTEAANLFYKFQKREGGQWVDKPFGLFFRAIIPNNSTNQDPNLKNIQGIGIIEWQGVFNSYGEGIYRFVVAENQSTPSQNDLYSQPFDLVQFECGGRNVDGTVVIDWTNQRYLSKL